MDYFQVWVAAMIFSLTFEGSFAFHVPGNSSGVIVRDINSTSAVFHCRERLIVRCYGPKKSIVNWQIAKPVMSNTSLSAQCFGSACNTYNNFDGRYSYAYDSNSGISDLTISSVNEEDNERQYKCNDGNLEPLKAIVKLVPKNSSFRLRNKTAAAENEIVFILETECTRPYINITWHSTAEDGTDYQTYHSTDYKVKLCNEIDCTAAVTESRLRLVKVSRRKRAATEGRIFGATVSYDSEALTFPVPGFYKLKVIQTVTPASGSGLSKSAVICMGVLIPAGTIITTVVIVCFVKYKMKHRRIKSADALQTPPVGFELLKDRSLNDLSVFARSNKIWSESFEKIRIRTPAADALGTPVGFDLVRNSVAEESAAFCCRPKPYQLGEQAVVLCCQQATKGNHFTYTEASVDSTGPIILRITTLKPGCVYNCSVFAISNNIRSEHSQTITITTLGMPDAPTDFRVLSVGHTYIHLFWIPGRYRMNQQRFVLELMDMTNGDLTVETIKMSPVIPVVHTVEELPARTPFMIKLQAVNDVGCSGIVGPIEVTTSGNPEPPSEFRQAGATSSSIIISWRPCTSRSETQKCIIKYGRTKKNLKQIQWKPEIEVDDDQPVMTHTLNNLQSGTEYAVVIFARNGIGESKRALLIVNTKEKNIDN